MDVLATTSVHIGFCCEGLLLGITQPIDPSFHSIFWPFVCPAKCVRQNGISPHEFQITHHNRFLPGDRCELPHPAGALLLLLLGRAGALRQLRSAVPTGHRLHDGAQRAGHPGRAAGRPPARLDLLPSFAARVAVHRHVQGKTRFCT